MNRIELLLQDSESCVIAIRPHSNTGAASNALATKDSKSFMILFHHAPMINKHYILVLIYLSYHKLNFLSSSPRTPFRTRQ